MRRILFTFMFMLLIVTAVYAQDVNTNDAGSISVGNSVSGEFEAGVRDRYTLDAGDASSVNILLDGEGDTDTYLRVYHEGEDEPFAENDDRGDGTLFSALNDVAVDAGETLIIEVGTFAD